MANKRIIRLRIYCILSPLVVTIISMLLGGFFVYWFVDSTNSSDESIPAVAALWLMAFVLINAICGLSSYTILFNLIKKVREDSFYSLCSFFFPMILGAILPFILGLFNDIFILLGIFAFFLGVLPFCIVQSFNYSFFKSFVNKNI